ncbi:MAG: hypothetical protein HYX41_00405 [Bdellovibrio sp.]|nr:hypothetical protein [Bdellovibrio sp.]
MENIIYLLAEFSYEFLLFIALAILTLICVYTGIWIITKRRYGVVDTQLPSGPVKAYLNAMIYDAEQLRAQLFGILGAALPPDRVQFSTPIVVQAAAPVSASPVDSGKLAELEAKLTEQMKALDSLTNAKSQLEKDLADARSKVGGPAGANTAQTIELKKAEEKIKVLESRLAEYNVIEDDLANLKRFQQENQQLKKALASAGVAAPSGGKNPAAAPESAPSSTPSSAAAASAEPVAAEQEMAMPEAAMPEPAGEPAQEAGGPQMAEPKVPHPATGGTGEKAEEDLVAEFEKMLKG